MKSVHVICMSKRNAHKVLSADKGEREQSLAGCGVTKNIKWLLYGQAVEVVLCVDGDLDASLDLVVCLDVVQRRRGDRPRNRGAFRKLDRGIPFSRRDRASWKKNLHCWIR